ncbi:unnamed protein product [Rhizopus stolonifer]
MWKTQIPVMLLWKRRKRNSLHCEKKCDSLYECEKHAYKKPCHPCSANTQSCPFYPSTVKTYPCGSRSVLDLSQGQEYTTCIDPIPTCESKCQYPPCEVSVQVQCWCQTNKFEKKYVLKYMEPLAVSVLCAIEYVKLAETVVVTSSVLSAALQLK